MGSVATIANSINSIVNQSDSGVSSSGVLQAIKNAAAQTGVSFSYLVQKASQESSLNPTAKAATSSATGLFQFTGQTWLQMVKQYGGQYGLGAYAAQISADANGHLSVADPQAKQAILALRNNPQISAEMAGELDKQNAASLQQNVGGKIGGTELYLAHFLGAGGASDFLTEMRANPTASAASVLPTAAASNPSVFYTASGEPRSLQQIYQHFAAKFDDVGGTGGTTQIASAASPVSATSGYTSSAAATAATIASLMPNSSSVSSISPAGFRTASATLSGSATMFSAMLLGQINDSASLGAINQSSDKKHSDALATLAAVA